MSKTGVAVFQDKGLILNKDGEVEARKTDTIDKYIFAYGTDYRTALKDFFRITGGVPLVPRYAFGNWWSRYRAYTQQEYVDLMQRFIDKDIPITVATIDMDWHWVNVDERFGTDYKHSAANRFQGPGWTGYSWNTDLFPDYKGFLKWLNEKGFKVTMNLHPADGVRHFEDMYEDMAREMGIDPDTKTDIPFDMTDNRYINAYFKTVNHPYEDDGVEFWWIDWQQGKRPHCRGSIPCGRSIITSRLTTRASIVRSFCQDTRRGQVIVIRSVFRATASYSGRHSGSSRISRITPQTSAIPGGATTSADICSAYATTNFI